MTSSLRIRQRLAESAPNNTAWQRDLAVSLCAASIKAADGCELTAEQTAQRQTWINEAIAALKQSIDKGWTDFAHMKQDPDLTILRDLPEFRAAHPSSASIRADHELISAEFTRPR